MTTRDVGGDGASSAHPVNPADGPDPVAARTPPRTAGGLPVADDALDEPDELIEVKTAQGIDKGWPVDETPLARRVSVAPTLDDGGILALVGFADALNDWRYVRLDGESQLALLRGLIEHLWATR